MIKKEEEEKKKKKKKNVVFFSFALRCKVWQMISILNEIFFLI